MTTLEAMKTILSFCIILLIACQNKAQEIPQSSKAFQEELNKQYGDPEESPLTKKDLKEFKGLPFFPIDNKYKVSASFKKTNNSKPFQMKTTTERLPTYKKFGEASFELEGKNYTLSIYQNLELKEKEEYKDYLFLPFTDATNGNDSYGGGRFLDLKIPDGNTIEIDFNKAYNPYCAYNYAYSCPVPPKENDLNVRIEAGVKYTPHD